MTAPYRNPGEPGETSGLTFASRQEERVWREFLVSLIRSGQENPPEEDVEFADDYLLAWRQRGGNDPTP